MTKGNRAIGPGPARRLVARVTVLVVALAAFLCLAAGAAAAATLHVAKSGNDSGDCVLAACATIQYAVDQAGPGDTVSVAAGGYDEEVTISTPGLTIQGAAAGGTVIGPSGEGIVAASEVVLTETADGTILRDLSIRSRAQNEAAILAAAGEPINGVTLDGVEVRGIGPSTGPTTVAAGLEVAAPASDWSIVGSSFEDNYTGILVSGDMENLAIEGSSFEGNRNGLYVARTLPLGPTSTGEVQNLLVADSDFVDNEYRGLYFEAVSDAVVEGVTVTGTGSTLPLSELPFGARGIHFNLKDGDYGDVSVIDSTVTGSVNEGIAVQVRGYPGDAVYEATPASAEDVSFARLNLVGNGGPGLAVDNEANIGSVSIVASRIVANGTAGREKSGPIVAPVEGVFAWNTAPGAPTVAATDNWFGCNAGPVASGTSCDAVNSPVAAPTWLVLRALAAGPQTLAPGAATTIVASLEANSAGAPALFPPSGGTASFSSSLGGFAPAAVPLSEGRASSTFTAGGQPGEGVATVSLDGETASLPLDVLAPPAPPPPPPPPAAAPPEPPKIDSAGDEGPKTVPASGRVTVASVACAADSCRVKATAPSVTIGGKSFQVKVKVPRQLTAGDSAPVRVVLPRKTREALESEGRGRLRVKLTVTGSDGATRTVTVTVVLKSKRQGRSR